VNNATGSKGPKYQIYVLYTNRNLDKLSFSAVLCKAFYGGEKRIKNREEEEEEEK